MARCAARVRRLQQAVANKGCDGLLVTNPLNVTYLTGFTGEASYLLVAGAETILVTDARFTQQLAEECPGLKLSVRRPGVEMIEAVVRVICKLKAHNLAVEAGSMTVGLFGKLQQHLSGVKLCPEHGLVERLRAIKDADEIAALRLAIEVAERAFRVVRAALRGDQTERAVANELEYQIRRFGGYGCSFAPIIAVGPRAALPHATLTDRRLDADTFALIDWGAKARLYVSDLTRVVVTGKIPPKLERLYGVVFEAQRQAIASIRPGVRACDVDRAARRVIERAGFGNRFGHGLGHGLGLEVHESPRLGVRQHEPLKAGMVVTVEPGVYLPGWGGVRIEDDVLVTRSGHEVLSTLPKAIESCFVPI